MKHYYYKIKFNKGNMMANVCIRKTNKMEQGQVL